MVSEMEWNKNYGNGNKDKYEILNFIENFDCDMTLDLEDIVELYNVLLFSGSYGCIDKTEAIDNFKEYSSAIFGKIFFNL